MVVRLLSLLPALGSVAGASTRTLQVVKRTESANGFAAPPRGFNTFGLQADGSVNSNFRYDQSHVQTQANALASLIPSDQLTANDYYISLDSGWSVGSNGDEYGRIIFDKSVFNITDFAATLHQMGLKIGAYILPGAFCNDQSKTIFGTNITLGSTFNGNNDGFSRCDFDFSHSGVQHWHNSVVNLFAEWGVDLIKLDFVTPGSPSCGDGCQLFPDNSKAVVAYHQAIVPSTRIMRLDISWKLERNATYFPIWNSNADSMRTDQDLNSSGQKTLVAWQTVQRAIENYRQFITTVPKEQSLRILPDMDNLFVGNPERITGVSDNMRQTIATHWIAASANLITGSDLTQLDDLGKTLLTHEPAWTDAASFAAQYPMQPRNPGSGNASPEQRQAWIGGPNDSGVAYVVLANYGPDQGQGGYGTKLSGIQTVTASWDDLGLSGNYTVQDVWSGDNSIPANEQLSAQLNEGQSVFYKLTPS